MYFPRPYPDELTSSLLIRASRHLGIRYDELVKDLAGIGRKRVHFTDPFALVLHPVNSFNNYPAANKAVGA